jgi:hypothetical protein
VGQRNEPGFKLGGRKIDLLFHHFNKELGKSLRIAHFGSSVIPDRPFCKKEGEQSCGYKKGADLFTKNKSVSVPF